MLSYLIIRKLREAWIKFDLTPEEGICQLSTLCSVEMESKNKSAFHKIPRPRDTIEHLLNVLSISLPLVLPKRKVNVVTRKKLMDSRKKR